MHITESHSKWRKKIWNLNSVQGCRNKRVYMAQKPTASACMVVSFGAKCPGALLSAYDWFCIVLPSPSAFTWEPWEFDWQKRDLHKLGRFHSAKAAGIWVLEWRVAGQSGAATQETLWRQNCITWKAWSKFTAFLTLGCVYMRKYFGSNHHIETVWSW